MHWDLNGIIEARAIDHGGAGLLSPNHMLYRPLGLGVLALARSLGYGGHSAMLQYLTAIMGGLAVGLFWLWTKSLTGNVVTASVATAVLATSRAFWRFSTDAAYIVPAATSVLAALVWLSTAPRVTGKTIAVLGCLVAIAVLFWQANIFLVPVVALGIA